MKADVEEVLLEFDNMVVVWSARDSFSVVACLHKEAGGFDDRIHGDNAGVGREGARWLMDGALVRASVSLLIGALVGRSLAQERRR